MPYDIKETDWKVFRQVREVALARFCERVLTEVGSLIAKPGETSHERYLAVYKLIEKRDKELAQAFNDMRRSTALLQIGLMHNRGLLTDEEMTRFSPELRDWVKGHFKIVTE